MRVNLVFLIEFCEFRPWNDISEIQLALSFSKLVSKKNFVEGKISLDQKFKKKSSQNQQVWELKFEKKKVSSQLESQNPNSKKESQLVIPSISQRVLRIPPMKRYWWDSAGAELFNTGLKKKFRRREN